EGWCRARALGLWRFYRFSSCSLRLLLIIYQSPEQKWRRLQDPILEPAPSPWLLVLPHSPLDSYTEALSSSISRWKSCNSIGLERKWGCSNVRKLEMRNEDK
ncbi:unnamed protein product, partial [Prunus brigantina]